MTDLEQYIQKTPLMDTHEHTAKEDVYVNDGPDVLSDLFDNYTQMDLIVAGATPDAVQHLINSHDPDIEARWVGVSQAWQQCQYTGFGQATRLIAKQAYGMDEITLPAIDAAGKKNKEFRQPGERLRILKEIGNLDHVQIDDGIWACYPDSSGPDFFLYDLQWAHLSSGMIDLGALQKETGIEIVNIKSMRQALEKLFALYGQIAVAVKSQYAYNRILLWHERTDMEAEQVLMGMIKGEVISEEGKLCIGDWCLSRGIELAIEYNLPFKIHTGYIYGYGVMFTERISSGHLCGLLQHYPKARFVLMHIAYPYYHELVAMAKHFPNVYVDMCWSWSIDPLSAADFLRHIIHAVPSNKLFVFGGDTHWPNQSAAYATQARSWLTRALQAEIDEGLLGEAEAISLATLFMRKNQEACFNLDKKRAAIRRAYTQQK
jgi:predicted TIM-barrel fold metal-dependent hydrolase